MININLAEIEKRLAKEMNGKLFTHIYVIPGITVDSMMCTKYHLTVLNGKVYEIRNGNLSESKDTLMSIARECRKIGLYEKGKVYENVHKTYTFEELAKRLDL